MSGQPLPPNAKSLLAALPDYSMLNAAERIQLECAAEGTFSDRGNPSRISGGYSDETPRRRDPGLGPNSARSGV